MTADSKPAGWTEADDKLAAALVQIFEALPDDEQTLPAIDVASIEYAEWSEDMATFLIEIRLVDGTVVALSARPGRAIAVQVIE